LARHTHHDDGGSVYRERDARIDHQFDPPQVAEQMRKLYSSVYSRRRYENKVKTDPALLGGRRRLIVCLCTAAVGGLEVLYQQAPEVAAREPARAEHKSLGLAGIQIASNLRESQGHSEPLSHRMFHSFFH